MTINQTKFAILPFDSKRYLLFDRISTVPFGKQKALLDDLHEHRVDQLMQ